MGYRGTCCLDVLPGAGCSKINDTVSLRFVEFSMFIRVLALGTHTLLTPCMYEGRLINSRNSLLINSFLHEITRKLVYK